MRTLKDPLKLRSPEVERIIQFPFTLPTSEEKTEEELWRIAERRREQGKKLQELAAKTRLEKVNIQRPADRRKHSSNHHTCSLCRKKPISSICSTCANGGSRKAKRTGQYVE